MSSQANRGEFDSREPEPQSDGTDALGGARYGKRARGQIQHGEQVKTIDRTCRNCGEHVSPDFVRVFGRDGVAHACTDCATTRDLNTGAGARPGGER